jgi:hypothetical protein
MLKAFIDAPWTALAKPENLELVNTNFILHTFDKREADIVYCLKDPENPRQRVYFYCVNELQSTLDYSMPVRLFVYIASIWIYYLKGVPLEEIERKSFRLPPVIPIVLYNGKEPWSVSTEFSSAYQGGAALFPDGLLNFKYHVIDVNRYSREELSEAGGLISAVFLVDQRSAEPGSLEYLSELLDKLAAALPILKELDKREGNIFLHWMRGIIFERLPNKPADGALMDALSANLEKIKDDTEAYMFVSNFAVDFGNAMQEYADNMARLKELSGVEQRLNISERGRADVAAKVDILERERADVAAKVSVLEREKAESQRALRQAVIAMAEAGIPLKTIAAKTGLREEEIARHIQEAQI